MSLASLLPAPSQYTWDQEAEDRERQKSSTAVSIIAASTAPPYGQRKGWVARTAQDFGDGGAYPEIAVAQYPLGMGYKGESSTSNALAVQLDAQGKVKYDVLARQGHDKNKIVYSKYTDLLPSEVTREDDPELQKPDQETIEETTEKTRKALEKLTQGKITAAMPVRAAEKQGPAQFIRYTPSQQGVAFNSGAKQRVIRLVEVHKDPMEPPKFRINKKIPRGPPSPPAPVMHSPTRKVTVKEQMEWKIPPCISNWKNAKGYTIPLDKRLSADGRGLQQVHINENFAKLAESLYIADRKAREAVEMRAQLEKKLARNEKEKKEENLRVLAQRARNERAGIHMSAQEEEAEVQERRNLLHDRRRDRDRERNIARAAPDKRSKLERARQRDITEQIALGVPDPRAGGSQETQFDQRLFNQSKGMDSGFGDDEGYNVYDKPWKESGSISQSIYRPSKNIDKDLYGDDFEKIMTTNRFTQDKGERSSGAARSGPVQFKKQQNEDDPFNLIPFLDQAKRASKRQNDQTSSDYKRRRRD